MPGRTKGMCVCKSMVRSELVYFEIGSLLFLKRIRLVLPTVFNNLHSKTVSSNIVFFHKLVQKN